MKTKFLAVISMALCVSMVSAQTVTITAKKQVYRRQKPMAGKQTFSIRRPIAKASTPALSKKITAAINPVAVLDIKLKDELRAFQWVEEADYAVIYNKNAVLSLEEWMEGSAAYPDSLTKHIVINLKNGDRVRPADVFSNLAGLARVVKKLQADEVKESIAEMKKDPELSDPDPSALFENTNFTIKDLSEFSVDEAGVTFYYDYGFPHVLQAAEPAGVFVLPWASVKPFIRRDGLLARFIR